VVILEAPLTEQGLMGWVLGSSGAIRDARLLEATYLFFGVDECGTGIAGVLDAF
jgi:hypothetical protein